MRSGAASASSIEHSSGSVFISQYFNGFFFEKGEVPRRGGGLAPEPWLNRVVAFRSHQVRPARPRRGTITTVTTSPQPEEAIGSEKLSPVAHCREQDLFKTSSPALQSPHRSSTRWR